MITPTPKREKISQKPVGTWLTVRDFDRLKIITTRKKQTTATFIRSVLMDAILDEEEVELLDREKQAAEEIMDSDHAMLRKLAKM
jgi:hypothetical protein